MTHSTIGEKKIKKKNCRYCQKPAHNFPNSGNSGRSSSFLKAKKKGHLWELGGKTVVLKWHKDTYNWPYTETTIEPHHLIPIDLMTDETNWKRKPSETKVGLRNPSYGDVLAQFGYNINCNENGAFYPRITELACHLEVPLHKSHHPNDTKDFAISRVKPIMDKIKTGKYCFNYEQLKKDLDNVSTAICNAINSFSFHYTISIKDGKKAAPRNVSSALTADYKDYKPGSLVGCGNIESLTEIEDKYPKCIDNRIHFPSLPKGLKSLPGGALG